MHQGNEREGLQQKVERNNRISKAKDLVCGDTFVSA